MSNAEQFAQHRKEAMLKGIGSPYRISLYCCARRMGMDKVKAEIATKNCDPKVVKRLEAGK